MKPQHIRTGGARELVVLTKDEFDRLKAYEKSEIVRSRAELGEFQSALNAGEHPLRIAREKRRMTQGDLSNACGGMPSQTTISRIEKWKATASREVADSIGRVLEVGVDLTRLDRD